MGNNIKLDYPDKHWDYTDSDSVHKHLVFLDKLENTKWNNIDDQIKDYEVLELGDKSFSFFEEPKYYKELEDAEKLCKEHEKRLYKLVLDNPGEENITPEARSIGARVSGQESIVLH